ncbi:MAG: hypothetical protein FJW39_34560, partial [Acidobacteria bacterium]|nr:hypothetical protein [Acidobacteriota bacterium]
MQDSKDAAVDVLARLESAATGSDIAAIFADPAVARFLESDPKRPIVGRTLQMLADSCLTGDPTVRARSTAALASLAPLKPLRGLVDRIAPRALSEPLPDLSSLLQPNERASIASWLHGRRLAWVEDFAARSAIAEAGDEAICRAFANLLIDAAASVAGGLQAVSRALASAGPQISAERTIVLCESLAASAQKMELRPGRDLASAFAELFLRGLLSEGRDLSPALRPKVGIAVARFAAAVISRAPAVLSSPAPSDAFRVLQKWIPA